MKGAAPLAARDVPPISPNCLDAQDPASRSFLGEAVQMTLAAEEDLPVDEGG